MDKYYNNVYIVLFRLYNTMERYYNIVLFRLYNTMERYYNIVYIPFFLFVYIVLLSISSKFYICWGTHIKLYTTNKETTNT